MLDITHVLTRPLSLPPSLQQDRYYVKHNSLPSLHVSGIKFFKEQGGREVGREVGKEGGREGRKKGKEGRGELM